MRGEVTSTEVRIRLPVSALPKLPAGLRPVPIAAGDRSERRDARVATAMELPRVLPPVDRGLHDATFAGTRASPTRRK